MFVKCARLDTWRDTSAQSGVQECTRVTQVAAASYPTGTIPTQSSPNISPLPAQAADEVVEADNMGNLSFRFALLLTSRFIFVLLLTASIVPLPFL